MGFFSRIFGAAPQGAAGPPEDADKAKMAFEERVRKLI